MSLLEIKGLTKNFGGLRALDAIEFEINKGEIVGLIGPNGAGKTTLFNVISGFLKPDGGSVFFKGEDITGLKPHLIAAKGIIRTFQSSILFFDLSVMQNVLMGFHLRVKSGVWRDLNAALRPRKGDSPIANDALALIEYFELSHFKDELVGSLPHGYQRIVGIAVAAAANPELLLLDEPVTGMDPVETKETMDRIRKISKKKAISMIIVEHDMKAIMSICEKIIVLNFGTKIAESLPEVIMENKQVIEAYLGFGYRVGE